MDASSNHIRWGRGKTIQRGAQVAIPCLNLLILIGLLILTGCSTAPVGPNTKELASGRPDPQIAAKTHEDGERILEIAQSMLGVPYRWGGKTPRGFDCSGLVFYAHKKAGILVPRTSTNQFSASTPIRSESLAPGDLVFFDLPGIKKSHVGIYVGDRQFVHAPSSGKRVSYARMDNPYWQKRFVRAGRLY